MYYVLWGESDDDGNMLSFTYKKDHRFRSFDEGQKFTDDSDAKIWEQHPKEPIRVEIEEGDENAPLPSFLEMPIPIMSKKLLEVIRSAGVNNVDAYDAELYYPDGSLASKDYVVFNLIGVIMAADMEKSIYDPDQPDRMIAMSFDSLTIDERKTYGFLMFRLAENITTILIHEQVKQAIEDAGIKLIRMSKTENVAIL